MYLIYNKNLLVFLEILVLDSGVMEDTKKQHVEAMCCCK